MRRLLLALGIGLLPAVAALGQPTSVQVAVAANFIAPMREIALAFQKDTGQEVKLSVGSTGAFHAQIRNGAPFDVLLAADDETAGKLEADGHAVKGSRFVYATGRLVLWSAKPGLVDAQGNILKGRALDKLAMADPKLAPYGLAAEQTLTQLGLMTAWRSRVVLGVNIGQTYQFVSSGNAAAGFVAMSQVMADGALIGGSSWVVPQNLHDPIRQEAVLLTRGAANTAARSLMAYLRGESARAIIARFGYAT